MEALIDISTLLVHILLFIGSVAVTKFLGTTVFHRYSNKRLFISYIVAFFAAIPTYALLLFAWSIIVIKALDMPFDVSTSPVTKLYMAVNAIIITNIACVIARAGIDKILDFHRKYNASNLEKHPLKFAIAHRQQIVNIYRYFFLLASVFMLCAIWFR